MYGSSGRRRPFSPDPNDPAPSAWRNYGNRFNAEPEYDYQAPQPQSWGPTHSYENDYNQPGPSRSNRREASDVSVEALDLADYARTLRREPERYNQQSPYPAFSPSSQTPPSLISRGDTLTTSSHSHVTHATRSSRRPTSLPVAYQPHNYPHIQGSAPSEPLPAATGDMDISHFPAWSRSWYNNYQNNTSNPDDIYTPVPKSQFFSNSPKRSPFDPDTTLKYPYSLPDYHSSSDPFATSSYERDSVLPWSNDPPDYGPPVSSLLKEERLRMLEREFGPNANQKRQDNNDFVDEDGKPLIGTVDSRGNMVTQGPKKRMAVRAIQIILACIAAIPAMYAALAISVDPAPPPAGKPPAFVLYVFSSITVLVLLWLFVFAPCCCRRKKVKKGGEFGDPLANGMMVLPVPGLPGGKKGKKAKGKKGKKGKHMQGGGGDVQVNLIVDPTAFGNGRDHEEESDGYFSDDGPIPGGYSGSGSGRRDHQRRRAPNKRRSVFAGLAMEEAWKSARSRMKKMLAFDIFGILLWAVVFVFVMIGERCPSGEFEGWCNSYNVSTAAACLLAVSFGLTTFFGVKDLHACKTNPRTRT